jgi:hypothetical protein
LRLRSLSDVPDHLADHGAAADGAELAAVYAVVVCSKNEETAVGKYVVNQLDGGMAVVGPVKNDNVAPPDAAGQSRRGDKNEVSIMILRP